MAIEAALADTNLFLRYLTNDVPEQADAVENLLRRAAAGEVKLVTNSLVIAEIVWTLESFYRLNREDVRGKVLAILNTPRPEVADATLVLQAVLWPAEKNVDFIDTYNAAWLLTHGLHLAYTFDRKHFSRLGGINTRTPGE